MQLTKVEYDTEHLELVERARNALMHRQLDWRHHGIGVLQAYLHEGAGVEHRLHIWSRSLLKSGIQESGDVHDHRFDMVSHVLFGTIINEEWHLRPDPLGLWTTMTLVNARAAGAEHNYHAPMTATGDRYDVRMHTSFISAGSLYRFPARAFHRSALSGFAITWVEKHNQTSTSARIAHPIDVPAVPAFGHETDQGRVDHLTRLAIEVLEAKLRLGETRP